MEWKNVCPVVSDALRKGSADRKRTEEKGKQLNGDEVFDFHA
jgi:hypothetical protein